MSLYCPLFQLFRCICKAAAIQRTPQILRFSAKQLNCSRCGFFAVITNPIVKVVRNSLLDSMNSVFMVWHKRKLERECRDFALNTF
ncbi:hypothetical protein BWR19_15330 [Halomonas sp. 1513]|nr:hypothetical protein BWR19_15330 [Halomonas sp. 1513]